MTLDIRLPWLSRALALGLLTAAAQLAPPAAALHAYGHAFSRPDDFTDAQIEAIASRFEIFTVEKSTAANKYGKDSSIKATVGTARRIKAVNSSVRVLMYWNAALHFGTYECESAVKPSWVIPGPHNKPKPLHYNYSVPAFRQWWVRCAVDAVKGAHGLLDGLFLDATPKVADGTCGSAKEAMPHWGTMVDQLRAALGPSAIIIDNGFYLAGKYPRTVQLAGADAWEHTGAAYAESLAAVGTGVTSPQQDIAHLRWLANASLAHPSLLLVGHGDINASASASPTGALDPAFELGLVKYMLVTSSWKDGWFLANTNYSIDGGLLQQPTSVYSGAGVGCGEPTSAFTVGATGSFVLTRRFERGTVTLDLKASRATIKCGDAVEDEQTKSTNTHFGDR